MHLSKAKAVVILGILVLTQLTSQPKPSSAQSAPSLQSILNSYLQAISGTTENVTVTGFSSVAVPCPTGEVCTWTRVVVLAAYAEGDAGGQALFSNDYRCPGCFSVLVAGGGILAVPEIENFGIDATTAATLATDL
jgi:hypothetical protein